MLVDVNVGVVRCESILVGFLIEKRSIARLRKMVWQYFDRLRMAQVYYRNCDGDHESFVGF